MPTGAPTPSVPDVPSGFRMPDGFSTRISFAADTTIQLWEKTVQPPAVDGGEPIDTTTMHNIKWHTKHPRKLLDLGPCNLACAYDPNVLSNILTLCNKNTVVTVTFPPGESPHTNDTLCFYGFLQKFEPEALKEGEMPMANVTIVPTNMDDAGTEQGPVWTAGTGTA